MNAFPIQAASLVKYYGSFPAVQNISFQVSKGEIYGLLGPNGAGKTTTLRMLSGILQPSEGEIFINGFSMREEPVKAKSGLGFITGDMNLYERLTPVELLTYFGNLYSVSAASLPQRVEELIEQFQISGFSGKLCGKLSTGQKQRVAIARTIIHDPAVVVLDEPTTGLDIMSGELILEFIKSMAKEHQKTIIFSTHNLSEVERLCDKIGIIHNGKLVGEGTIEDVKAKTKAVSLSDSFFTLVEEKN